VKELGVVNVEAIVKSLANKITREYHGFNLDTEDLVSEGLLIATEQMRNYRHTEGASLSTYLFRQVDGRLRNYVRRKVIKATHGTEALQRVEEDKLDEVLFSEEVRREQKLTLDAFRESLETEREVKVFDMLRCGYTFREIASTLGISTGSISNLLTSWRKALWLKEH